MLHRRIPLYVATALTLASLAGPAFAQGSKPFSMSSSPKSSGEKSGSKSGYRSFMLAMPVVTVGRGTVGRMEFNLAGRGSLALEGSMKGPKEDIPSKSQKLTGESLITKGRSAALLYARYSEPMQMGGLYYALGAGYRQETAQWRVAPNGTITGAALDEKSLLNHAASLSGPTGHLRAGYRYVGTQFPLLIGAYLGVRHFEATVKDSETEQSSKDAGAYSAMSDAEKQSLKRRFATAPEVGIEVGFAL